MILNVRVAADGKLSSVQRLSGDGSLAEAARAAVEQWSFAPGKRENKEADSAAIVAVVFLHAGASHPVAKNN